MNLVRFDPFRDLDLLSGRLSRMVTQAPDPRTELAGSAFGDWVPAVDVEESDREYLVKADLPALKRQDVHVAVDDGVLTIEGERKQEKEEKGRKFHRMERSCGKFIRRIALPSDVDQPHIGAAFSDGVLQVHLPKAVSSKPRAFEVNIA